MRANGDAPGLRLITTTAVISRLAIVATAVLMGSFIAAYDTSGRMVCAPMAGMSHSVCQLLSPLANWDGVFFMEITEHGYQVEQVGSTRASCFLGESAHAREGVNILLADVGCTWRVAACCLLPALPTIAFCPRA